MDKQPESEWIVIEKPKPESTKQSFEITKEKPSKPKEPEGDDL